MSPTNGFNEADLHAFADGELDPAKTERISIWLKDRPELLTQVEVWRSQNMAIAKLFGAEDNIEPQFRANVSLEAASKSLSSRDPLPATLGSFYFLALSLACCVLCFAALAIRGSMAPSAQSDGVYGVAPLTASPSLLLNIAAWRTFAQTERSGVEEERDWAARARLGFTARPFLPEARLVSTRLLPTLSGPVVFFVFETQQLERVSLTLARTEETSETKLFRFADANGVSWPAHGQQCALVGALSPSRLKELAKSIRFGQTP